MSRLNEIAMSVGMSINSEKTNLFSSCIPDQGKAPLRINGRQLEEVDRFKYLGAKLLPNAQSKDDIVSRIDAARWVFSILRKRLWIRRDIFTATKIRLLSNATFCLLVTGLDTQLLNTHGLLSQLTTCLVSAAIPVFLTNEPLLSPSTALPFWEVLGLHWRRTVLFLPAARMPHLPELLDAVDEATLIKMRAQGQIIWNKYLSTKQSQLATIFLTLSRRLGLRQPPVPLRPAEPALILPLGNASSQTAKTLTFYPSYFYEPRPSVLVQMDVD
ncbi:unnamed protein product, partial [Dibothriocephalus latus]